MRLQTSGTLLKLHSFYTLLDGIKFIHNLYTHASNQITSEKLITQFPGYNTQNNIPLVMVLAMSVYWHLIKKRHVTSTKWLTFFQHAYSKTLLKPTSLACFPTPFCYFTATKSRTCVLNIACQNQHAQQFTNCQTCMQFKWSQKLAKVCLATAASTYMHVTTWQIIISNACCINYKCIGRNNRAPCIINHKPCTVRLKKALHASHEATP